MPKPKNEPGRSPWMSDAGYASAQRAAGLAPTIGATVECQLQLKCPHCDFLAKVGFDAATAIGDERTTSVDCESCGEEFFVDAAMRIDVRPE